MNKTHIRIDAYFYKKTWDDPDNPSTRSMTKQHFSLILPIASICFAFGSNTGAQQYSLKVSKDIYESKTHMFVSKSEFERISKLLENNGSNIYDEMNEGAR